MHTRENHEVGTNPISSRLTAGETTVAGAVRRTPPNSMLTRGNTTADTVA
jgi:hypothetical protein